MKPLVGVVANPAAGRDIRRIVARASVFPTAEKSAMVQRVLTALGAVGVERVLAMPDLGGIAAGVLRMIERRNGDVPWPQVEFLDLPLTQTAADTTAAVREMVARGAVVIVVLGGDGTCRVVAAACESTPLVALSTGTNNVFPQLREATVAGLAAGLVATGAVDSVDVCRTNKVLEVDTGDGTEIALVDVCATTHAAVGARAVWQPGALRALYVAFAEPDAVGLSSIAGLVRPVGRDDPHGLALRVAPAHAARWRVRAPIAPGLVADVGVDAVEMMAPGEPWPVPTGVISLDGEREMEPVANHDLVVRLRLDGPRTVDVTGTLRFAAARGLLRDAALAAESQPRHDTGGRENTW